MFRVTPPVPFGARLWLSRFCGVRLLSIFRRRTVDWWCRTWQPIVGTIGHSIVGPSQQVLFLVLFESTNRQTLVNQISNRFPDFSIIVRVDIKHQTNFQTLDFTD